MQGDPADSLYRAAHDFLARGEYGRSAQLFKEIGEKFPNTRYKDDLPYNEAFARYRIETTRELETAARLLKPRAEKLLNVVAVSYGGTDGRPLARGRSRASEGDVVGLYIKINQALARRGNSDAAKIVNDVAKLPGNACDGEDRDFKRDAIGALSQMDPQQAIPIIKAVLNKRDECTVDLRRSAVFILGRLGDAGAAAIVASTAKDDPSPVVRAEAVNWLPKLMGDAGVAILEDVLRTEQEERIQRSVVRTLAASPNPRARTAIRTLIDRKDAPINLRIEAVNGMTGERATTDDAAYLRGLYARADNDQLKQAIVSSMSRIGGQEADEWILNIARSSAEPSSVRGIAISRVMQSGTIADWIKLYDASESFDIRRRIVTALENRKETEAGDKLVDIAKTSTVPSLRVQAIQALTHRKDPRLTQLLDEIVNGRKP
jgi:HEAT repeat protein